MPISFLSTNNRLHLNLINENLLSLLFPGPAQGCGGYFSMPMGMFGSPDPNLDGRYEPRMNCLWTIEMPVNKAINLTFNSFDLESSSPCGYDFVKVMNTHGLLMESVFCKQSKVQT